MNGFWQILLLLSCCIFSKQPTIVRPLLQFLAIVRLLLALVAPCEKLLDTPRCLLTAISSKCPRRFSGITSSNRIKDEESRIENLSEMGRKVAPRPQWHPPRASLTTRTHLEGYQLVD